MTRKITKNDAVKMLNKAIDTKGQDGYNYVYKDEFEACRYTNGDMENPVGQCIVGQAFVNEGFQMWQKNPFRGVDKDPIEGPITSQLVVFAEENDIEFTEGAKLVFVVAQTVQDGGGTWGVAVDAARTGAAATNLD